MAGKKRYFIKKAKIILAAILCLSLFTGNFLITSNAKDINGTYSYTKTYEIKTSNDDCAISTTSVNFTSTGVYLHGLYTNNVHQDNYLRFTDIDIPADSVITNAYISFTVRDASTKPTTVEITGETGSGDAFGSAVASFNNRTFTSNCVQMTTPNSITHNMVLDTPDLSEVINEMRSYHTGLTNYVFKIVGNDTGSAIMRSYNDSSSHAPKLVIEYASVYGTFENSIASANDKAEEYGTSHTGTLSSTSSIAFGGYRSSTLSAANKQICAFRFSGVALPQTAEILDAYLEFTPSASGPANRVSNMVIKAELGDAKQYSASTYNISKRTYGEMSVKYQQTTLTSGQRFRTPNLKDLIDENRLSGWQSGQALAFMFDGDNYLGAVNQGPSSNPAKLFISYKYRSGGITIPGALTDPEEIKNVYLNEVSNGTGASGHPWLELYNDNEVPVILSEGMFLSDDGSPDKYEFNNFLIPSKGFKALYVDGEDNNVSANFTLDNSDKIVLHELPDTPDDMAQLMIHQIYGGGNADGAVNFSFVELYNPNDSGVSLNSYSLQYFQNPSSQAGGWETLPLSGAIPAHGSFLIVATGAELTGARYVITDWDQEWAGMTFSNRAASFALVKNQIPLPAEPQASDWDNVVDLVGIQNSGSDTVYYFDGAGFVTGISKQKTARRVEFSDTGNNNSDFETLDYRVSGITETKLNEVKPRASADGSWGGGAEEADHLIINQTYGSGPLDNSGSVSHSFIELYNPTNNDISLEGYSIQVQNGKDSSNTATGWEKYNFNASHIVKARSSFLIRLALAAPSARYVIPDADVDWTSGRVLSNRAYSAALVSNQDLLSMEITSGEMSGVIDLVGALNTESTDVPKNYESVPYQKISKQQAARRVKFQDTDNNYDDFESIDYRASGINDDKLAEVRPRWSGDGPWGGKTVTPPDVEFVVTHQTLTLSAFYNNEYHTVNRLPYYKMEFDETYGRFTDGDDPVAKFDGGGTFEASNNTMVPVMTYAVNKLSGQYNDPIDVTIRTENVNTVKYTLDGSTPSETNGLTYTGDPIHIDHNAVLRIYIFNARGNSGVLAYVYDIGQSGLEFRNKTVSSVIATGNDDLRATASAVNLTETSLYLNGRSGSTDLTTYLRFTGIDLPADAVIANSYIAFTTRTASSSPTSFMVSGELGGGAGFTANISSVNGRSYTTSSVTCKTPNSIAAGVQFNTGDLTPLIREMLGHNGNLTNYVFKVEGDKTGAYAAQSYEGNRNSAPKLVIEYFSGYDKYVGQSTSTYDSAEEYGTANTVTLNGNIEIGGYMSSSLTSSYKQISGFRFPNVSIPSDAEVTNAYIEFTVASTVSSSAASNMVIKSEAGNPAAYAARSRNISDRKYGQISVKYQQQAFRTAREAIRTPNIKDLIEENRLNGWQSGQAMAFVIDGDNYIGAVYQTSSSYPPKLVIEYQFSGRGPVITGAVTDPAMMQNIFINEVSGEGTSASKETWLELYNNNNVPVILGKGTYLSDKNKTLDKFQFGGLLIPAKGYRVVFCDKLPDLGKDHAGISLDSTGTVYLSAADAAGNITVIDEFTYGEHLYNQTVGRMTDGSSDIILFQSETFGKSNNDGLHNYKVTVSKDRGVYDTGFSVSISASKPSATVKYSIDGVTTPSAAKGIVYSGPIGITKSCVLKIYAYDQTGNSGIQAYTYILKDNLKNEVRSGSQWQYISTITSGEYGQAMSCFPIVSVTSESGSNLSANADYVRSTFEFIDAHLGKGNNNYFSNSGSKKFGQASITWYNSGVDVKFHRDYNTKKAKVNFFDPMPEDQYPTPVKYNKLQLKEGEDGPQSDVWNLGYLRYSDSVVHTLGIQMGKFDLRTRYVQYFFNGKYFGLKTLREAFSDGTFENYFGDDSDNYTTINFQDGRFTTGSVLSGDGNPALLTAIRSTVTNRNLQEFKKYVDIQDFIKFQILFMFVDSENEAEAILHNDAYSGNGVKMITNINDLDGAFHNDGHTGTGSYAYAGGGGTYRHKWGSSSSRRGIGGWFGTFSGDSTSSATVGNLEFKTLVKDQVLQQIGPSSGDLKGAPGAPLSLASVQQLISQNFAELNNNFAYKVDAAYMGARSSIYQDWLNMQTKVQSQTVDRVSYSLQRWAAYGMAHTLSPVTINDTGSGLSLNNPNNTDVYYTTDGSDPMGPDGTVSSSAVKYTKSSVLPYSDKLTVRPFTTNNWGPITNK